MKRIVICADGTWNAPNEADGGKPAPTNVARIAQAIAPTAPGGIVQSIFYHDGVGTHPGLDHWFGGIFGTGLDRNIRDAYRFVVQNFEPGDELFLFGFSRGAFTVRSLAGMIRKCGVLKKERIDEVSAAFAFYRNAVKPTEPDAVAYRLANSRETRIKCIGVWDTVGALGIPGTFFRWNQRRKYAFHDVSLSTYVDNAFHALAVDERREPFEPTVWNVQQPAPGAPPQTVKQVWFAGVHSDVGGGYATTGLSDIALAWMIRETAGCGLAFLPSLTAGVNGDPYGELHNSMQWFYRGLGDGVRTIGSPTSVAASYPVTMESLAPAVLERYDHFAGTADSKYCPKSLCRYFARTRIRPPC